MTFNRAGISTLLLLLISPVVTYAQTGVFGGIELASSSIKGLSFTFAPGAEPIDPKAAPGTARSVRVKRLQYAERNRNFISMKDGCKLSAKGLDLLVSQTNEVIKELRDGAEEHKLGKLDLFVVGSSGIGAVCNTDEIIARVQAATGLCMEIITASDEARYSMGFVLPRDRYRSVMLDIGSGNTKGGYYVTTRGAKLPPREWHGFEITYGARTLKNEAMERVKTGVDYYAAVDSILQEKVLPQIEALKAEHSGLSHAWQYYMIGGSLWGTSTWAKPVQQVEWAINTIRLKDYDDLLAAIKDDSYRNVRESAFTSGVSAATRTAAESELVDVLQRFDKESLYAGVSLSRFVAKQLSNNAIVYFPTTAAWISGYAREKFDETRTGVPSCKVGATSASK